MGPNPTPGESTFSWRANVIGQRRCCFRLWAIHSHPKDLGLLQRERSHLFKSEADMRVIRLSLYLFGIPEQVGAA